MAEREHLSDRLPNELWFMVMDHLKGGDLKTFSSLDHTCRDLAVSKLFSHIRLSNETTNFDGIDEFLEKYGDRVTNLHYDCYLHPRKPDYSEKEGVLVMAEAAQALLAGKGLPRLKTVTVEFHPEEDFNGMETDWTTTRPDHYDGEGTTIYLHQAPETTQEVTKHEHTYQWRADIADFFNAVSKCETLERMEVLNLAPRHCSSWDKKQWSSLLNRLTSFQLRIWGGENGAGWHSNTMDGYGLFITALRNSFFRHLASVKQFYLIAEKGNGLGGTGQCHTLCPISPEDLPQVTSLKFENCFVDPALSKLICAKKDQLETLTLTNCMAYNHFTYVAPEDIYTWTTFLKSILKSRPTALTSFAIDNENVKFHEGEYGSDETKKTWEYGPQEEAEVKALRKQMAADPRLKLFRYAGLDEKYGWVVETPESNMDSYQRGEDQAEYDALVKLVAENRKSGLSRSSKRSVSDDEVDHDEASRKKKKE